MPYAPYELFRLIFSFVSKDDFAGKEEWYISHIMQTQSNKVAPRSCDLEFLSIVMIKLDKMRILKHISMMIEIIGILL